MLNDIRTDMDTEEINILKEDQSLLKQRDNFHDM